ncbi:MAG: type I-F CRISPR-associated protein Csy1, partial [Methylococcaceae bacterium]|nr:type I-F CRISPR-associated protein Csy1 [Methylococcaceae bacterium]
WIKAYRHDFWQLQKLYKPYKDNKDIKIAIENVIISVFQQVIEKVWQTRQLEAGWSEDTSLNSHQKIWLDNAHTEQRETEDDWLNKVITDFSIWFISAYTKTVGEEAIALGDVELAHIKKIISDYQEDLR